MLSIATMFVLVWILQIQNALMVALAVIMTSEFGGLMLGRLRTYACRIQKIAIKHVRRTLIDICFERYNQILVLNQYDITKEPVAKLFGRDGYEKEDFSFDFGTGTDLKVCNGNLSTKIVCVNIFRDHVRHHSTEKCSCLEVGKNHVR